MTLRRPLMSSLVLAVASIALLPAAANAQTQTETMVCPSQDFTEFFEAFSNSAAVQRAFTGSSVDFTEIDATAQPEPREVTVNRPLSAIRFPVIASISEQQQLGLSKKIDRTTDDMTRVVLEKPDTDFRLVYVFADGGDCWELYSVVDTSL